MKVQSPKNWTARESPVYFLTVNVFVVLKRVGSFKSWGIFCGGFQCLPVDDCSAVSCDSGSRKRE